MARDFRVKLYLNFEKKKKLEYKKNFTSGNLTLTSWSETSKLLVSIFLFLYFDMCRKFEITIFFRMFFSFRGLHEDLQKIYMHTLHIQICIDYL